MLTHSRTPDLIVHMELTDVLQYYMGSLFEATGFIFISFSVVISRSIVMVILLIFFSIIIITMNQPHWFHYDNI